MSALNLKNRLARTRKKFKRQESHRYKKLGTEWRRPRGKHSKMREGYNNEKMVSVGYRGPATARGLHSSGKKEILIHTPKELEGLKDVIIRIGATVGRKKRLVITQKAQAMKLELINPVGGKSGSKEVKNEPNTAKTAGK